MPMQFSSRLRRNLVRWLGALLCAGLLAGCGSTGGFNAAAKMRDLRQGMSQEQVRGQLGSPTAVRTVGTAQVWRYSLHQSWKGWVPFYLVFAGPGATLREWFADEAEFQRNQAALERQWAPVVNSLNRSSGGGSSPGAAAKPGAESDDCKRARTWEDRMVLCHGVDSSRVMR